MDKKAHLEKINTQGIPRYFKTYKLSDGSLVNVCILDTAGQEKFKSVTENYYKKADCCLLVYDITRRNTFKECTDYYTPNIRQKCKKNIQIILLGNKTDLEDQREVKPEEGANFANENGFDFMETSCLQNKNVANAFEALIEMTNIEAKKNIKEKNIELTNKKEAKHKCQC